MIEERGIVDKVTCIAFHLYQSSQSQDIQEMAIQLLNGEVSLRDLKKSDLLPDILKAESYIKKNKINKNQIQNFAEKFMTVEV